MRVEIDIDDDILRDARERAARHSISIDAVINQLARSGIQALSGILVGAVGSTARFGFAPKHAAGRVVSNKMIDRLRAEVGD